MGIRVALTSHRRPTSSRLNAQPDRKRVTTRRENTLSFQGPRAGQLIAVSFSPPLAAFQTSSVALATIIVDNDSRSDFLRDGETRRSARVTISPGSGAPSFQRSGLKWSGPPVPRRICPSCQLRDNRTLKRFTSTLQHRLLKALPTISACRRALKRAQSPRGVSPQATVDSRGPQCTDTRCSPG